MRLPLSFVPLPIEEKAVRRSISYWRRSYERSAAENAAGGAVAEGAPLKMLLAARL